MDKISLEQEINWREKKLETYLSTKRLMMEYGSPSLSFDDINRTIEKERERINGLKWVLKNETTNAKREK